MAPKTSQPASVRPIWSRKLDLFWVFFLSVCIFFGFSVDVMPFYASRLPPWATALYDYFITEFRDPLYVRDPPFFKFYLFLELFYIIPTCVWSIRGLIIQDPMTPLYLLLFSFHYVISDAVCFVEMINSDWPREFIVKNVPGYLIMGSIVAVMWVDMLFRVRSTMIGKVKVI